MSYNYKKHAEMLLELEGMICNCLMVSEGLRNVSTQIDDKQYSSLAAAVFSLMVEPLEKAFCFLSENGYDFATAHGYTGGKNGELILCQNDNIISSN